MKRASYRGRGNFKTFKERGEWVELQFMAAASSHGYHVLKPWGDSLEYDVAIEHGGDLVRVQVKSSSVRNGTGYFCQFRRVDRDRGFERRFQDYDCGDQIPRLDWDHVGREEV